MKYVHHYNKKLSDIHSQNIRNHFIIIIISDDVIGFSFDFSNERKFCCNATAHDIA